MVFEVLDPKAVITWQISARLAGLRFQTGFWKKSSWNESGDYMEKVSARTENVHAGLEGWKTSSPRSKISARVETCVWAGALREYSTKQNVIMENLCLNPGWISPCNRNKIAARVQIRHVITPLNRVQFLLLLVVHRQGTYIVSVKREARKRPG